MDASKNSSGDEPKIIENTSKLKAKLAKTRENSQGNISLTKSSSKSKAASEGPTKNLFLSNCSKVSSMNSSVVTILEKKPFSRKTVPVERPSLEAQFFREKRTYELEKKNLTKQQSDILERYNKLKDIERKIQNLKGNDKIHFSDDLQLISYEGSTKNFLLESPSKIHSAADDKINNSEDFTTNVKQKLKLLNQASTDLCQEFLKISHEIMKNEFNDNFIKYPDHMQNFFKQIGHKMESIETEQGQNMDMFIDYLRKLIDEKILESSRKLQLTVQEDEIVIKLKELKTQHENDLLKMEIEFKEKLDCSLKDKEHEVEELKQQINDLEILIDTKIQSNKEHEENIKKLTEQIEKLKTEVEASKTARDSSNYQPEENVIEEISKDKQKLEIDVDEIENLRSQLIIKTKELKQYEQIIGNLQRVLRVRSELINSMQDRENFDKRKISELTNEIAMKNSMSNHMEYAISMKEEEINNLMNELDAKHQELKEKGQEIKCFEENYERNQRLRLKHEERIAKLEIAMAHFHNDKQLIEYRFHKPNHHNQTEILTEAMLVPIGPERDSVDSSLLFSFENLRQNKRRQQTFIKSKK